MSTNSLSDEGFIVFALEHYENPQCSSLEEFYEDLDRLKYLKRLLNRVDGDESQKNRLAINHMIVFTNVFGIVPANRILFFKMESKYHISLKTYLYFLNLLATDIPEVSIKDIEMDKDLLERLKKL